MAKKKSNWRIRKKHQKRDDIRYIESRKPQIETRNLSSKELTKERKRIERNEARKQSRAESKAFLIENGLSTSFINRHKLNNKKASSFSKADLNRLHKIQAVENAGGEWKESYAKMGWETKLSEKFPNIIIPEQYQNSAHKIYRAKDYLYVGTAPVNGEFRPQDYRALSVTELEAQINDRINEAHDNPTGSSHLYSVFRLDKGTKDDCQESARTMYKRGYSMNPRRMKLDSRSYSKVTVSNIWTKHEFLSMALNMINQMQNEVVGENITYLRTYCKQNNLPFMNNISHKLDKKV